MISTILVEYSEIVPLVLLLAVSVGICVGYVLLQRGKLTSSVAMNIIIISLMPIALLTLVPTGRIQDSVVCAVQFQLPTIGTVELLANIALFVVPAFFLAAFIKRPLLTIVIGSGLSALIELLQSVLLFIGRACDTNDWLMNSIGVVIGVLLAIGITNMLEKNSRETSNQVTKTRENKNR